jgi:excisionase family DNA binding protein
MTTPSNRGNFLTTTQAAERLHVHPKTVGRWAREGRLACLRTLGGHRRFDPHKVERLAADLGQPTSGGPETALGRAVVAQLAVQGWATTRQPGSPPDDPFDPAA